MTDIVALIIQILQLIWSWVYFIVPFKATIIHQGSKGVRLTFGINPVDLEPGFRFGTIFQTLHHEKSRHRTNVINSIRFNLADGTPAKLDATIVYDIVSYGSFMLNSEDSGFMVAEFANAEVKRTVARYRSEALNGNHDELESEITEAIQAKCDTSDIGVLIRYSRITDVEILNASMQTSLCLHSIINEMGKVMSDVDNVILHPSFPAMVALVTGNIINAASIEPETNMTAQTKPTTIKPEPKE